MSETKIISLQFPIELKKKNDLIKRIDTLTVRRIKAKDLRHFPKEMIDSATPNFGKVTDIRRLLPLIAALCDITIDEANEIDVEVDLVKVVQAVVGGAPMGESAPLA